MPAVCLHFPSSGVGEGLSPLFYPSLTIVLGVQCGEVGGDGSK